MRLWHQTLIPYLPRQQLLGQHRELAALRGKSWGKKHSVVDYVFTHDPAYLVAYHYIVMNEMEKRGYKPDPSWRIDYYRGKILGDHFNWCNQELLNILTTSNDIIYPEHNDQYLQECLENLKAKGINIDLTK